MINSELKNVAQNAIAPIITVVGGLMLAAIVIVPGTSFAATNATEYVNANATGSTQNGTQADPFLTISAALATLNASTSQATTTIEVAAGTYNEDLTIPQKNLTIQGAGAATTIITSNGSSTSGISVTGQHAFTLSGVTFTVSPTDSKIVYAVNAYEAQKMTLSNDVFNGLATNRSGQLIDGIEINTSDAATLSSVTTQGFGQDGVSVTSKYLVTNPNHSVNMTFNNVTATNNSSNGIAFYTVSTDQGGTGEHRIAGATFTGTNILSDNGNGLFIEGDTNANYVAGNTPRFVVVSNPPQQGQFINGTLDVNHVNFSGNFNQDIVNYQTAAVNAVSSQFNGLTGTQMTATQRQQEESRIYDQRVLPSLGLVTFF